MNTFDVSCYIQESLTQGQMVTLKILWISLNKDPRAQGNMYIMTMFHGSNTLIAFLPVANPGNVTACGKYILSA